MNRCFKFPSTYNLNLRRGLLKLFLVVVLGCVGGRVFGQSATITSITGRPCMASTDIVNFSETGYASGTYRFTVQISDKDGNFPGSLPSGVIGTNSSVTFTSSVTTGTVTVTIPTGLVAPGSGYKVRIFEGASGSEALVSAAIGFNINIDVPAITFTSTSPICNGASTAVSASVSASGSFGSTTGSTGYSWNPSSTVSGLTTVGGVSTGTANPTSTTTYTVTGSDGNTCPATGNLTITVDNPAQSIAGPGAVCVNSSITLSDVATGGTWSITPGVNASINSSGVVTGLNAGTEIVKYTGSNACGGPYLKTQTITINPLPVDAFTTTLPSSFCSGQSVNLAVTDTLTSYTWTHSNVGTATYTSISRATATFKDMAAGVVTDTVFVKVFDGTCSSTYNHIFTVNPLPIVAPLTATRGGRVCAAGSIVNNTINLSDTSSTGTLTWATLSSNVTLSPLTGSSSTTVTGDTAGSATIKYYVVNAYGCRDSAQTIITIDSTPKIIGTSVSLCSGQTIALFPATSSVADSFMWSANNSGTSVLIYPLIQPTVFKDRINDSLVSADHSNAQFVPFTFTSKNISGCEDTGTIFYQVNPGAAPTASFPNFYSHCSNDPLNINLAGSASIASNYHWTRIRKDGNLFTAASDTGSGVAITDTFTETTFGGAGIVVYSIKASDTSATSNCASILGNITVSINPLPKINPLAVTRTTICSGDTINIHVDSSLTTVSSHQFKQLNNIGGIVGITGYSNAHLGSVGPVDSIYQVSLDAGNYSAGYFPVIVTAISDSGCTGIPDTITFKVNPKPIINTLTHFDSLCSENSTNLPIGASTGAGGSFSWVIPVTNINISGDTAGSNFGPLIDQRLINSDPHNDQTVTYQITPKSDVGCVGIPFNENVTVHPIPVITGIGAASFNQYICNNSIATIATIAVSATSYIRWTPVSATVTGFKSVDSSAVVSGGSNAIFATPTLFNQDSSVVGSISYNLKVVSYPYGCTSPNNDSTITVNVLPTIKYTGDVLDSVCNDKALLVNLQSTYVSPTFVSYNETPISDPNITDSLPTKVGNNQISVTLINNDVSSAHLQRYVVTPIVTVHSLGCPGRDSIIGVKVYPTPHISTAAGSTPSPICSQTKITYTPSFNCPSCGINNPVVSFKTGTGVSRISIQSTGFSFVDSLYSPFSSRTSLTATYNYTFSLGGVLGCTYTDQVDYTVNPTPEIPSITYKNDSVVCKGSENIHFERNDSISNVSYKWESLDVTNHTNDTDHFFMNNITQKGADLTFSTSGDKWVRIKSYITTGTQVCANYDSVKVTVKNVDVDTFNVYSRHPHGNAVILSCDYNNVTESASKTSGISYKWTREDVGTFVSGTIANVDRSHPDNYQYYVLPDNLDPSAHTESIYWVRVYDSTNACPQRSYFWRTGLPGHARPSQVATGEVPVQMLAFPNPATSVLNILLNDVTLTDLTFEIWDMTGSKVQSFSSQYASASCSVSDFRAGVYQLICYKNGKKIATSEIVKQ